MFNSKRSGGDLGVVYHSDWKNLVKMGKIGKAHFPLNMAQLEKLGGKCAKAIQFIFFFNLHSGTFTGIVP